MANKPHYHVVQHLLRIVERRGVGGLTDARLLERFVADGDQAAFEVLVWRHGPMVLGVCRRILRQEQNAEDAFQAAFLTLARKAGSLRGRDNLPGWLYRVASRIALRARAAVTKRALRERPTEAPPETLVLEEPADVAAHRELQAVLDEELLRLPRKYRRPLILCDLQGKSHVQAARELGQAPGSMSRHLERARELLRCRLTRRGVTLSAGLLTVALADTAVPAETLVRPTVTAAALFARGGAAAGVVRGAAILLANDALRTMIVNKLRAVTVILLLSLACGGAGLLVHQGLSAKQSLTSPQREQGQPLLALRAGERPKAEDGEKIGVDRQGDPLPAGAILRLGSVRLRHGARVNHIAFSPDGKMLASAGDDRSVRIWDAKTGAELQRLDTPSTVLIVAFSPDGKMLALGGAEFVLHLYSVATGKEIRQFRGQNSIFQSLAFAPDGKTLASGTLEETVHLWETATGKQLRHWLAGSKKTRPPGPRMGGDAPPPAAGLPFLAFSTDGKTLATAASDANICFWEAATGKELHRLPKEKYGSVQNAPYAIAFSPDGRTLAVGGGHRSIHLLDATGRELRRFEAHPAGIASLAFSADGKTLATGGYDGMVCLWETASGKRLQHFERHSGPVRSVTFSPDDKTLASAGEDPTVRLWDTVGGKEILSFPGHRGLVSRIAFAPDGKTAATASHDCTVRLWNTTTGAELRVLRGSKRNVNGAIYSPDGKRIVTADSNGDLRVWDVASGKELRQLRGHRGAISDLAISPNGRTLASGGEDAILRIWDVNAATELHSFQGQQGQILRIAFSPDGKTLVSASADNTIRLWNAANGDEIRRIGDKHGWPLCVAFSPDGKILATGRDDGLIRLWEVETGDLVRELKGHRSWVSALAFAPDGKTLASSSYSGAMRLWEVASGRQRYRSVGHRAAVWSLAFSADGRLLASASSDSTALLWDMTGRDFVAAPPEKFSPEQLAALWKDLTGEDAVLAYRAVCTFCRVPDQAVPFLQKHARQGENPNHERIAKLVRDLDDDAFKVRERASRELADMGDLAEPTLRDALEKQPTAELRRRVASLLAALRKRPPSAERLHALRVTEVLERLATSEARRLLETFAAGATESPLTAEAKASLERRGRLPR